MSTGEFAAASGLSPKALRIYAEARVLSPAFIDPANGYRYYRHEQLADAKLVLLLRRAGVSLAEIRRFLAEPSPSAIREWEREMEADARARRDCFQEVRRLCGWDRPQSGGTSMAELREVHDRQQLIEVFNFLGRFFAPHIDATDEVRFADLDRRLDDDRSLMLVAQEAGERVGGALAFRSADDSITLRIIGIAPRHRRRGIGRQLVEEIERRALGLGVTGVALGTDEAVGFWFRLGYTPMLLLQWVFDVSLADSEIELLMSGPLEGLEHRRQSFNGVPQLFVDLDEPRLDLREKVREMVAGCHVGFCMYKTLVGGRL